MRIVSLIVGLVIGLIVGVFLGVLVMCLGFHASSDDDARYKYDDEL